MKRVSELYKKKVYIIYLYGIFYVCGLLHAYNNMSVCDAVKNNNDSSCERVRQENVKFMRGKNDRDCEN